MASLLNSPWGRNATTVLAIIAAMWLLIELKGNEVWAKDSEVQKLKEDVRAVESKAQSVEAKVDAHISSDVHMSYSEKLAAFIPRPEHDLAIKDLEEDLKEVKGDLKNIESISMEILKRLPPQ